MDTAVQRDNDQDTPHGTCSTVLSRFRVLSISLYKAYVTPLCICLFLYLLLCVLSVSSLSFNGDSIDFVILILIVILHEASDWLLPSNRGDKNSGYFLITRCARQGARRGLGGWSAVCVLRPNSQKVPSGPSFRGLRYVIRACVVCVCMYNLQ